MNNQLSSTKAAEYTSNQGITKSQKILNSVSNFHMKTEQGQRNEQDLKSPQNNKGELRQTWRKPRMPYNKLPDAFQIKPKKKKTNKELLDNIDRIVKFNEYKQIQKYLEPISVEKKQEERPKDFIQNGNPLATYQKYLKIKNKFSQQIQQKDLSMNKYKAFSSKQAASSIKITDCITLQAIKRRRNTGTIKKMLHVPTLKLLCVRQEPLNSKEARHSIKQWLLFWQTKLNFEQSKRFINVLGTVYNVPQGAVSIITQYCKFGSLLDLLGAVVTLPQSVIRQIFVDVFQSLGYFYQISQNQFGGLSPSQIMITDQGKVKIGLGIYYNILAVNTNSIYNIKINPKSNLFQFNATQKHFIKNSIDKESTTQIDKSLDIFKLGLMMLQCAIGGFETFEHSSILHEAIKNIFTEEGQNSIQRENVCCLIHSQAYLIDSYSQLDQRSRRDKIEISKILLYSKYLKDRFSMPFINFLCQCLKLNHNKRATFRELISHSFLRNNTSKDTKTVMIELGDLLQINNGLNQQFIESMQQQRGDKFIGHVLHVLNGCKKETIANLVNNQKDSILNLSKNIGLNYMNLGEKLYNAMVQMLRGEKRDFTTSI